MASGQQRHTLPGLGSDPALHAKAPDLPHTGRSRGVRGPRVMSPCPGVTASALPWAAVGEETEPGTREREAGPGLAPRARTPSPVTGRQDVGKPTSPNFNTASHVTSWFPHAAARAGRCPPSARRPAPAPSAAPHSGEGPRPQGHTRQGGATSKVQAPPPACFPRPGPGCRPVSRGDRPKRGHQALLRLRPRLRLAGKGRSGERRALKLPPALGGAQLRAHTHSPRPLPLASRPPTAGGAHLSRQAGACTLLLNFKWKQERGRDGSHHPRAPQNGPLSAEGSRAHAARGLHSWSQLRCA